MFLNKVSRVVRIMHPSLVCWMHVLREQMLVLANFYLGSAGCEDIAAGKQGQTPTTVGGTHAPSGATLQVDCVARKYSTNGEGACTDCPADSSTASAGSKAQSACNCNANFYGDAQGAACAACPNGATIAQQSSSTATTATVCACPVNTYGGGTLWPPVT